MRRRGNAGLVAACILAAVWMGGCGSSGDSGSTADPGALQLVNALQTAVQDNSRAEASPLYAASYSFLGQSHDEAVENVFSGFSLLNSFLLSSIFHFSRVSLQVQSYVSQSGGAEMVVRAEFGGAWTPFSLGNVVSPTNPNASGTATLDWQVSPTASGQWQITAQRILDSEISTVNGSPPDVANLQVNGQQGPVVAPGANLHVTGTASGASAVVVVPDFASRGQNGQIIDLTVQGASSRAAGSLTSLSDALQAISAQLGTVPAGVSQQFATDLAASTSPGAGSVIVLALSLDPAREVIGERIRTTSYTVAGSAGPPPASPVIATVNVGSMPVTLAIDPGLHRVFVLNAGNNSVTAVDETTNTVVGSVPVGGSPAALVIDPVRHRGIVSNSADNTVTLFDTMSLQASAPVSVGAGPRAIAVDSSSGRAYVINSNDRTVSAVDDVTGTVSAPVMVGQGPEAIAVDPGRGRVFVVNASEHTVSVIDESSNMVTSTVTVGQSFEPDLAVDPKTGDVYVSNTSDNTESILDGSSLNVRATVPVGQGPVRVLVNPATEKVYVANLTTLSVIQNDAVTHTIPVSSPAELAINSSSNTVYVVNDLDELVTIDGSSDTIVSVAAVPLSGFVGPTTPLLAIDEGLNRAYLVDKTAGSVSALDLGSSSSSRGVMGAQNRGGRL